MKGNYPYIPILRMGLEPLNPILGRGLDSWGRNISVHPKEADVADSGELDPDFGEASPIFTGGFLVGRSPGTKGKMGGFSASLGIFFFERGGRFFSQNVIVWEFYVFFFLGGEN